MNFDFLVTYFIFTYIFNDHLIIVVLLYLRKKSLTHNKKCLVNVPVALPAWPIDLPAALEADAAVFPVFVAVLVAIMDAPAVAPLIAVVLASTTVLVTEVPKKFTLIVLNKQQILCAYQKGDIICSEYAHFSYQKFCFSCTVYGQPKFKVTC